MNCLNQDKKDQEDFQDGASLASYFKGLCKGISLIHSFFLS